LKKASGTMGLLYHCIVPFDCPINLGKSFLH
jgi:hypothetical protein